ncbi:MAG TPA: class IV adenylate cyclase [Chloroflexota bacterium]|jgi:predicted adenylyl cyclase CyaB|nr:class IV adenylate cyclase [Chloroflexota bacterium]
MIEREIKIRVADHQALRPLLKAMGATSLGSEEEINRILDTAESTLYKRRELLRVRSTSRGVLTWKGPAAAQDSTGHKMREELEVPIPGERVDTLLALLAHLGYHEVLRYDKVRETWRWQGVEIVLDSLEFGDFVEIEGEAGAIEQAIHLLHLDGQPLERRSYAELQRLAQQERGGR